MVDLEALQALYERAHSVSGDSEDMLDSRDALYDAWPALRDELLQARQEAKRGQVPTCTLRPGYAMTIPPKLLGFDVVDEHGRHIGVLSADTVRAAAAMNVREVRK